MSLKHILTLFVVLSALVSPQLTSSDISYIKDYIISHQDSKNGLFFNTAVSTRKASEIFSFLNITIPNIASICKDLQYEITQTLSYDLVLINSLLKCNFDFSNIKLDTSNLFKQNMTGVYEQITAAHMIKLNGVNWNDIYTKVSNLFYSKNKFSFLPEGKAKSIYATALGLDVLSTLYEHVNESNQKQIKSDLLNIINVLQSAYQELSNDIITFSEKRVSTYRLNSQMVTAFKKVKSIINIPKYDLIMNKLLNYFIEFKYEIYNLDNIYYLTKVFHLLSNYPIMFINNTKFDYIKDKVIPINFVSVFGKDVRLGNATLTYEVTKNEEEKSRSKKKSDYDLDDDDEDDTTRSKSKAITKKTKDIIKQSQIDLDVKDMITEPGYYTMKLTLYNKKQKTNQYKTYIIRSISEITIDHIKIEIDNQIDSDIKEKEITVEYPKRSFRSMKATQDSIIRLKVKLSSNNKIEQILLRLKHIDTERVFSAYVSDYIESSEYYFINFAMDDPVNMESYNGEYELYLIISDLAMNSPIIWSFGKIEITFRKPSDPNELPNYKNPQKNKMEPTFNPEQSLNKNYLFSMVFCACILFVCFALLVVLKTIGVNVSNFPQGHLAKLYSVGFIVLLSLYVYIIALFWVKLNILQTMGIFTVVFIPGAFIVYKAMKNLKIEI